MCRHSYLFDGFFILTFGLVGTALLTPPQAQATSLSEPSSIGPNGIDASVLQLPPYNLTGRKIAIGQVEPGRPGLFGFDKKVIPASSGVPLAGLFFRDRPASPDTHVDTHAHSVASLMVGWAKGNRGIAPDAQLYSAALGSRRAGARQPEQCLTLNHVAEQNGGDVRAINLSFGESLRLDRRTNALLDGNALLTQCLDWSARVHDVLYAVAGNQGKGGIPIPTDHYNGVTVAYTRRQKGVFRKVDFANLGDELVALADRFVGQERNTLGRSSVSLVAPGHEVTVLDPGGDRQQMSGTSFAAPHVTATVALLQEQGDRIARHSAQTPIDLSARRHEVIKAILLNSADKLQDEGQGAQLGMTKTILGQDNHDWRTSPAQQDANMPLDPLIGAGQLNALRAYAQLSAGRQRPRGNNRSGSVKAQGWDYGTVSVGVGIEEAVGTSPRTPSIGTPSNAPLQPYQDYVIEAPLQGGSYFAATLTWDRQVELVDVNRNDRYDLGERFRDRGLNDLDLHLMHAEDTDPRQALWSSTSMVDSVEHIFQQIPTTGRYKLRVQYRHQQHEPSQAYGLAWWGVASASQQ